MRYALILLSLLFSSSVFANDIKPGRYYEDQPDVNDDFQIHLMYLLAKDSEDRGWDINGKISDIITKMNDQMFRATSENSKSGGIGKKMASVKLITPKLFSPFLETAFISSINFSVLYTSESASLRV